MKDSIQNGKSRASDSQHTGAVPVPSFSKPGKIYMTNPITGFCQCDRYRYQHFCKKHVVLAEAIMAINRLRSGRRVAYENLLELARKIFAPIEGVHPIDSFKVYLEARQSHYATPKLKLEALRRHRRVLALADKKEAA